MRRAPQQARIGYFGKLPARSDFIKAIENIALAGLLDQWMASVMNLLTADPRWKLNYDALRPLNFAFVGMRSKHAIAGRLMASQDQSQRRFPFLTMSAIEIDEPAGFVAASPLVLAGLWRRIEALLALLPAEGDPAAALHGLASGVVDVDPGDAAHAEAFSRFLQRYTLEHLDGALAADGFVGRALQLMLAIGLLLQPVQQQADTPLAKGLKLPLPRAPDEALLVASFWLRLITPFLNHADIELALFFVAPDSGPALVVGFCGAAPQTLQAIIDPYAGAQHLIDFDDMAWVGEYAVADPRVAQLAACLAQPGLTLQAAGMLFRQTFAT